MEGVQAAKADLEVQHSATHQTATKTAAVPLQPINLASARGVWTEAGAEARVELAKMRCCAEILGCGVF